MLTKDVWIHMPFKATTLLSLHFWAAAPKGSMTYAFTYMGHFLLLLLLLLLRPPPLNPSLEAHIPVSRPKSQPQGLKPSLEAQIPALRPLSLEARIWALRLGFGP